jgi:hypothetical protein
LERVAKLREGLREREREKQNNQKTPWFQSAKRTMTGEIITVEEYEGEYERI